jgi:methionyl-tRNA formyltransferase
MCKNNKMKLFFPIWHWKIPENLIEKYDCIAFHMTDLPFGRGGHPLQNLIIRGIKETKITAFRVTSEIDGGEILYQKNLSLEGSAEQIWKRASDIIVNDMIPYLMKNDVKGRPQSGEIIKFKRFAPVEIGNLSSLEKVQDCIRMSDAPFYDKAFIETDSLHIEFFDSHRINNNIECKCRISKLKRD